MLSVEAEPSFREREEAVGGPLKRSLNGFAPELFPLSPGKRFRFVESREAYHCISRVLVGDWGHVRCCQGKNILRRVLCNVRPRVAVSAGLVVVLL